MDLPKTPHEQPERRWKVDMEILEAYRSPEFRRHLDQMIPRESADELKAQARAKILWHSAMNLWMHYEATKQVDSLNRAIDLMKDSLEELPKPHPDLNNYATIYAELIQTKVAESDDPVDVDQYISALHYRFRFTDSSSRDELLKLFHDAPGENRFSGTVHLGVALYYRFFEKRQTEDLDKAIYLLDNGLMSIPRNNARFNPLKEVGLKAVRDVCWILNTELPTGSSLDGMIGSLETILVGLQMEAPIFDELTEQLLRGLIRRFFQPAGLDEIKNLSEGHITGPRTDRSVVSDAIVHGSPDIRPLSHQKLSNNQTHIRLLELLPGKLEEPIKCKLAETGLNGIRSYEALSYVWGNPNETITVSVNDATFRVTRNLHSAMLRLRDSKSSRTLWIDAICINQTDLTEKQHQIEIMREIYRQATSVILWLGEPQESNLHSNIKVPDFVSCPEIEASPQTSTQSTMDHGHEQPNLDYMSKNILERLHAVPPPRFEWLKPVLFGTKPAISHTDSLDLKIPAVRSLVEALVNETDISLKVQTCLQDQRARNLPGLQPKRCDWTSLDTILPIFNLTQTPNSWPLLGAFSLIFCLRSDVHFNELPFFEKGDELAYPVAQAWIQSATKLVEILESDYWDRAWILQEVVLAKDPVLHYGSHIISFESFVRAQQLFDIQYNHCCAKWGNNAQLKQFIWWTKIYHGLQKFRTLAQLRESLEPANLNQKTADLRSLFNLLATGVGRRQATDPRDLVYGILGLVDDNKSIDINYTHSVARVYACAAFHIIMKERSMRLLSYNDLGRSGGFDLLSWVPDWSSKGVFCPQLYKYDLYAASKGRPFNAEFHSGCYLEVTTVMVDKEQSFWRAVFADITREKIVEESPHTAQTTGIGNPARRMQTADLDVIQNWWKWLQAKAEVFDGPEWVMLRDEQEFGTITDMFWTSTETRKLMRTSSGRIGSGPSEFGSIGKHGNVSAGDEIHIVFGCNLPVILRPVQSCQNPCAYKFIGTCYLNGVMDGEAVLDASLKANDILLH
ncbi:heterokaryon incompatibility protein-domain-containing protein [Jackrogersella minutella]|nr:heterokaryon incompatibility protein-domain-containing protein [Jackrogersella minutella]